MTQAKWRVILRWTHIVLGVTLMCYIYSPFSANPHFQIFVKFIVVPVIAVTGVWIWKFTLFNKILKIKSE